MRAFISKGDRGKKQLNSLLLLRASSVLDHDAFLWETLKGASNVWISAVFSAFKLYSFLIS